MLDYLISLVENIGCWCLVILFFLAPICLLIYYICEDKEKAINEKRRFDVEVHNCYEIYTFGSCQYEVDENNNRIFIKSYDGCIFCYVFDYLKITEVYDGSVN